MRDIGLSLLSSIIFLAFSVAGQEQVNFPLPLWIGPFPFEFVDVVILPVNPTPTDDIMIKITLHYSCARVTFSDLSFYPDQKLFEVIVLVTPLVCSLVCPAIYLLSIHEANQLYSLGRLDQGRYRYRLLRCWFWDHVSPSECSLLWRGEFEVRSVEQLLDRNDNGRLDDDEILFAVELWIEGEKVPGTSINIDDAAILRLIELWITGAVS